MVNRASLNVATNAIGKSDNNNNSGIQITENLLLCSSATSCYRILVFKESPDAFSVDFVTQIITGDSLVVIAPKQFPFMSKKKLPTFICFEIAVDELQKEDLLLLYSIMFQKQKVLFPSISGTFFYTLLKDLMNSNHSSIELNALLKSEMRARVKKQFGDVIKINDYQFQAANHVLDTMNRFLEFNIEHTYISNYINEKVHNDRSLLRICKYVFKVNTRELLKYQLLLKAIQLLGNKKKSTISIAYTLGYSSISALNKFVKKQTDKTPIDIRKQILMIGKV